jgi:hypothetical protein
MPDPFDSINATLMEMADCINPLLEAVGCDPITIGNDSN